MTNPVPWTERSFRFDLPVGLAGELLERLRGTPARAEEAVAGLPAEVLTRRDGETWSIQENIAHIADLEDLFTGRLDDIEAGRPALRPADMTNRLTHEAGHNDSPIGAVLERLRTRRAALVARVEAMTPEALGRGAMHPRLRQPMRVIDMMLFHAEHDDYHLARVRRLIGTFAAGT